jgi:hypothetical protein
MNNTHRCIRCSNPIDLDNTDWCDVCNMSIFDDRMVKPKKMLTIQNISLLNGAVCDGWVIDSVLEDVYRYDTDLNIIEPKCYSISFVSPLGMNRSIQVRGKLLLTREYDKAYKKQYRFELWLNGKKFNEGGITANGLKDKDSFIQSVVDSLDFELKNK